MKATLIAQRYCRVLGLTSDASAEEIRVAYYGLAFTHHPDRNPGDACAAARFKEIQVAYEWLSHRRVAPTPAADHFPFLDRGRPKARLVWRRLAALAVVAVFLAITLTVVLRTTPRTTAVIKPQSSQLEQHPDRSLVAINNADSSRVERSAAGKHGESSLTSLLESVEWSPPASFESTLGAASDAVCKRSFSAGGLTEAWHSNPSWQESLTYGLPIVPTSITSKAVDSLAKLTPKENDQQVLIENGLVQFGDRHLEPDSLEPGLVSSALQSAAWQPEPVNDIPGEPIQEPQPLFHQSSLMNEHTMPKGYEIVNSGEARQQPKKNDHSRITDLLRSTTDTSNRGQLNPALINPLERFSSTVSKDASKHPQLFPDQPKGNPGRHEEKLIGNWPLHQTHQKQQSSDRASSTATADLSTWGTNSKHKAWPQSGVAAGNAWDRKGSFTQNSTHGFGGDFSVGSKGGATVNLGWTSPQASATSFNHTGLATLSQERGGKVFLSPTASQTDLPIQRFDQSNFDRSQLQPLHPSKFNLNR